MQRTLIACSRLILDSPWLMLLGFAVVVLPGGLLLSPVLASKMKRARAATVAREAMLIEPMTTRLGHSSNSVSATSSDIESVPAVRKSQ